MRRTSDDLEADVFFDSDGQVVWVKEATGFGGSDDLEAWLGGADARVSKWYDGSGNGHDAISGSNGIQPRMIENTTTTNGNAYTIHFDEDNGVIKRFSLPDGMVPYASEGDTSYSVFIDYQDVGSTHIAHPIFLFAGNASSSEGNHFGLINYHSDADSINYWYLNDVRVGGINVVTNKWWTTYSADSQGHKSFYGDGATLENSVTMASRRVNPPTDQFIAYDKRDFGLNGDINTILIYDSALPSQHLETVASTL